MYGYEDILIKELFATLHKFKPMNNEELKIKIRYGNAIIKAMAKGISPDLLDTLEQEERNGRRVF